MSSASRRASRWWRGEITGPGNIEMNNSTPLVSNYYLTSQLYRQTVHIQLLLLSLPVISGPRDQCRPRGQERHLPDSPGCHQLGLHLVNVAGLLSHLPHKAGGGGERGYLDLLQLRFVTAGSVGVGQTHQAWAQSGRVYPEVLVLWSVDAHCDHELQGSTQTSSRHSEYAQGSRQRKSL